MGRGAKERHEQDHGDGQKALYTPPADEVVWLIVVAPFWTIPSTMPALVHRDDILTHDKGAGQQSQPPRGGLVGRRAPAVDHTDTCEMKWDGVGGRHDVSPDQEVLPTTGRQPRGCWSGFTNPERHKEKKTISTLVPRQASGMDWWWLPWPVRLEVPAKLPKVVRYYGRSPRQSGVSLVSNSTQKLHVSILTRFMSLRPSASEFSWVPVQTCRRQSSHLLFGTAKSFVASNAGHVNERATAVLPQHDQLLFSLKLF